MQKKCKICIKNHEIVVSLKNTATAELIWKSLPFSSDINLWGEEVYFYTNLSSELEDDAKDIISFGSFLLSHNTLRRWAIHALTPPCWSVKESGVNIF